MMDIAEFYDSYGETLAMTLPDVAHRPEEPRFLLLTDNGLDELVKFSPKPPAGTFLFCWEQMDEELSDGKRDNFNSRLNGSLAVLTKPPTADTPTKRAAQRACRRVALQAIDHMRNDAIDGNGLLYQQGVRFEMDGQAGEYIGLVEKGYVGYGFSFTWLVPLDLS